MGYFSHKHTYGEVLTILVMTSLLGSLVLAVSHDYCEDETFIAECAENEVVVMTEAMYGRMRQGRCVSGQTGCSIDVLAVMDEKCSGRKSCTVDIRDLMVEMRETVCDKNLRNYLQADYICVQVVVPPTSRCLDTPVQIRSSTSGYLASYITGETQCGGHEAPWRIQAEPGQKINLTLFDFGTYQTLKDKDSSVCRVLAVISDSTRANSRTVCAGVQRVRQEYVTIPSDVEIRIISAEVETRTQFLLKFEVVGCPQITVNSNTQFKRTETGAQLRCVATGDMWNIRCVDSKWTGNVANCTAEGDRENTGSASASTGLSLFSLPSSLSIIIVFVIATLIGLCILGLGMFLFMKRGRFQRQTPVVEIDSNKLEYQTNYGPRHYDTTPHSMTSPEAIYAANPEKNFGNAYFRTWELQRHGGPPPGGVGAHGQGIEPHFQSGIPEEFNISPTDTYHCGSEHIYESPKSVRREFAKTVEGLQYYELDPSLPENQNAQIHRSTFGKAS